MSRGIRNLRGLKVRRYATNLIGLSKYLAVFTGEKASEKCV